MVELKFKRLHRGAQLPRNWSAFSVGYDVHAYLISETGRLSRSLIPPNNVRNIPTGLLIEPPPDHFVMVCSRSGLAKDAIFVANAPGIIDPDYRGELRILLYNGGITSFYVEHGMRIAQLFVMPITRFNIVEVDVLSSSERGERGFGSTGL